MQPDRQFISDVQCSNTIWCWINKCTTELAHLNKTRFCVITAIKWAVNNLLNLFNSSFIQLKNNPDKIDKKKKHKNLLIYFRATLISVYVIFINKIWITAIIIQSPRNSIIKLCFGCGEEENVVIVSIKRLLFTNTLILWTLIEITCLFECFRFKINLWLRILTLVLLLLKALLQNRPNFSENQ